MMMSRTNRGYRHRECPDYIARESTEGMKKQLQFGAMLSVWFFRKASHMKKNVTISIRIINLAVPATFLW